MRFRSADRLDPSHVGRRVTVRRRLPGGALSDVVGVLEELDDVTVAIRDRTGALVRVARTEVVAARVVRAPE